jgi:hypothetical protein
MSALTWCCWDQWRFTNVMDMLEVSMLQNSSWDKFRGEIFCERIGTLRGVGRLVIGVTTLGSNGALVVSLEFFIVCDLVWHCWGMGEAKIGVDDSAGIVRSAALAGAVGSPKKMNLLRIVFLKICLWKTTVGFDNFGERTRVCPRCVHWPWPRCRYFDIGSDALLGQRNIRVARGVPKYVTFPVSRVQ